MGHPFQIGANLDYAYLNPNQIRSRAIQDLSTSASAAMTNLDIDKFAQQSYKTSFTLTMADKLEEINAAWTSSLISPITLRNPQKPSQPPTSLENNLAKTKR
ncbi:MAG: hypothetical protein ACOYK1_04700 [Vampirovibrionia bacterium]